MPGEVQISSNIMSIHLYNFVCSKVSLWVGSLCPSMFYTVIHCMFNGNNSACSCVFGFGLVFDLDHVLGVLGMISLNVLHH